MSPGMASVPRVRPRRSVRAIWLSTSARVWVRSPEALGGRLVRRGVQLVSARGTEQTMRPNGASVELGEAVMSSATYKDAPTESIDVGGTRFAYRRLGAETGVPVILLNHLGAVLDNWDPRVIDGVAARHQVVAFDNRGIGASGGSTPDSVEAMARDTVAFIRALGFDQVDLLGFSLGGMVSQVIVQEDSQLVRKLVLAGTGPAGGEGMDKVTPITIRAMVKGGLTFKDPKYYLFFTRTPNGRTAAREFLKRLKERTDNRDKRISPISF